MSTSNTLPWSNAEHAAMKWEQISQTMSSIRCASAAVVIGNQFWVFGGYGGNNNLSSSEMFDSDTEKWTSLPPMPTARRWIAAVAVRNQVFVIGGQNGSDHLSTMEVMDVNKRQWTSCPSMSTPRQAPAAVAVGNHIFVMGGYNKDSGCLNTAEMYNIDTRKWTNLPPMSTARCGCSAAVVNDNIYVFGGKRGGEKTAEMLNTATQEWTALSPIPYKHSQGAAVPIENMIVLMGGEHESKRADIFDTETQTWYTLPHTNTYHEGCAAAMIQNQVIVAGGSGSNIVERLALPNHFGIPTPPDIPPLLFEHATALQEWLDTTIAMKKEYLKKVKKAKQKIEASFKSRLDELEEQLRALLSKKESTKEEKHKLLASVDTDANEWVKALHDKIADARVMLDNLLASLNPPPAKVANETKSAAGAARGRAKKDEAPPAHLVLCPITKQVMKDPVFAADGRTYERVAIERHIAQVPDDQDVLSPVTGDVLPYRMLAPNVMAQELVRSYNLEQQNKKQG